MTTADALRDYLFGALIPTPKNARPDEDANLFDYGLDSLRILRLLVFVQEDLGVEVRDDRITPERISTLRKFAALVDESRNGQG